MFIPELRKTEDGFEMNFGINHLGHFLLTTLLLPLIKNSAATGFHPRIVIVSSLAHTFVKDGMDWNDLMHEKGVDSINPWTVYGNSKLANILHGKELAERLKNSGITVYSLHPGI